MDKPKLLLSRLDAIGRSLSKRETSLALLALGSAGTEWARLDRFSDLDFFVIVKSGSKAEYLKDLAWLYDIAPVAFYFQNTADGYKLLYEDGVFCEFAVFEKDELKQAAYAPGRVVWKANGVGDSIAIPQRKQEVQEPVTAEWLIGEALSNLYIGLMRHHRGEKLSAVRFIQSYAVDHVLMLVERGESATAVERDPFNRERRFEARFPNLAPLLPAFLRGYEHNQASALALLTFLDENFTLNNAMKQAVLELCLLDDSQIPKLGENNDALP